MQFDSLMQFISLSLYDLVIYRCWSLMILLKSSIAVNFFHNLHSYIKAWNINQNSDSVHGFAM